MGAITTKNKATKTPTNHKLFSVAQRQATYTLSMALAINVK